MMCEYTGGTVTWSCLLLRFVELRMTVLLWIGGNSSLILLVESQNCFVNTTTLLHFITTGNLTSTITHLASFYNNYL